jgi:UDP-glucuronate decarboxylase
METDDSFAGPVNLGNPVEFEIAELAELIVEMTGSRSSIVSAPLPQDDPRQRRPDISLAKRTLGWHPVTDLREGLTRTVAYFDALLSASTHAVATLPSRRTVGHPLPEIRHRDLTPMSG